MTNVTDITGMLRCKGWETEREKEFAFRYIEAADTVTILSDAANDMAKEPEGLPPDVRYAVAAYWRFSLAALLYIKEVAVKLSKAARITNVEIFDILVAEEMSEVLQVLSERLMEKMSPYRTNDR